MRAGANAPQSSDDDLSQALPWSDGFAIAAVCACGRCAIRWIVERTFAWLLQKRRLVVDYEKLPETSESLIYIAMVHLMSKRLSLNK